MTALNGKDLLGRPVKIKPGVAKSSPERAFSRTPESPSQRPNDRSEDSPFTFDRWQRNDASTHFKGYSEEGRRLYVGGLPRLSNQEAVDVEIQNLFKGYTLYVLSEELIPYSCRGSHADCGYGCSGRPLASSSLLTPLSGSNPVIIIIFSSILQRRTKRREHKLPSTDKIALGVERSGLVRRAESRGSPKRDRDGLLLRQRRPLLLLLLLLLLRVLVDGVRRCDLPSANTQTESHPLFSLSPFLKSIALCQEDLYISHGGIKRAVAPWEDERCLINSNGMIYIQRTTDIPSLATSRVVLMPARRPWTSPRGAKLCAPRQ
jgi:hypothetical protein